MQNITLIQLVGGEPQPNILTALAFQPSRIVLVRSKDNPNPKQEAPLPYQVIQEAVQDLWSQLHPGKSVPEFHHVQLPVSSPTLLQTQEAVAQVLAHPTGEVQFLVD